MAGKVEFETMTVLARRADEAAQAEAARPRHEDHPCEICDRPGSFGFGPPGFANIHKPRAWFCGKHKHLGEELLA